MRRLAAVSVVVLMTVSLALQFIAPTSSPSSPNVKAWGAPSVEQALFEAGLDTSAGVAEYPIVSRALMLPSGSTDATLADIDGDGLTDLLVAVYETKNVSVFYRQIDGTFETYPSFNISLLGYPLQIETLDVFTAGHLQVAVLERKTMPLDSDRLEVFNYTARQSYQKLFEKQPLYSNANTFQVGNFNGDQWPDFAISCAGDSPTTSLGAVEIAYGPYYSSRIVMQGGHGTNGLVQGDLNNDGKEDLAVPNRHDSNLLVYYQPFTDFMSANLTVSVPGNPLALACGRLSTNDFDDIVVLTQAPSGIHFYQQFLSGSFYTLPTSETFARSIERTSSSLYVSDLDDDALDDVVVLSDDWNVSYGFYQRSSASWPTTFDFKFPTGSGPRAALAGDLDGVGGKDLTILCAASDWSGSSIGVFQGGQTGRSFTNSNSTIWGDPTHKAAAIDTGDINGDGIQDLVLSYPDIGSVAYSLSGNSSLQYMTLGSQQGEVIVADVNNDGFDDIVASRPLMPDVRILFGQSSLPGPVLNSTVPSSGTVRDIALGDLNNDSMIDLAVSVESDEFTIFYNAGNTTAPYPCGLSFWGFDAGALSIADLNSDGLSDLAFSNESSATCRVEVLLQRENATAISLPIDITVSTAVTGVFDTIATSDVTGDGRADIEGWMAGDPRIFLFNQQSFGTGPYRVLTLPEAPTFLSFEDATDDGLADMLVIYDSADLLFLHKQNGSGLHQLPNMAFVTGAGPDFATVGDATGDGRGDLITSDGASFCLSVWEQLNFPPVAHAGGPYHAIEGSPVTLEGSVETGFSELPWTTYEWEFGDGTASGWLNSPVTSHIYQGEGVYGANLTVIDPAGLTDSSTAQVEVSDSVPRVDFTWSPGIPFEGETVVFTDTSVSHDPIVRTNWTARDSRGNLVSSSLDSTLSFAFDNGTFTVTLELIDSDGSVNMTSKQVTVLRQGPQVVIRAPSVAMERANVAFSCDVDPWHGGLGDRVTSFEWNFNYTGGPFVPQVYGGTSNATSHSFESLSAQTNYTVVVKATDEDGDFSFGFFNITILDVTVVTVQVSFAGPYYEWSHVNFTANVDSAWSPVSYAWDFDSSLTTFSPDVTGGSRINHTYEQKGNYMVRVRVEMSNSSSTMSIPLYVEILDLPISAVDADLVTQKTPQQTAKVKFNATTLLRYHDIVRTYWNFGDGVTLDLYGPPEAVQYHVYVPDADYTANLTVTDDDGNSQTILRVMKMSEPVIELRTPEPGAVINSGTPLRFTISDDSPPLLWVRYSHNSNPELDFSSQWEIQTDDWPQGLHSVVVRAADKDGNIAISEEIFVAIDDIAPLVELNKLPLSVYGGSRFNITIVVTDENVGSVVLYVKFPGDETYQPFEMALVPDYILNMQGLQSGYEYRYSRVVDIPMHEGEMSFYVEARDLASNANTTTIQTIPIRLHLLDVIWPYLMVLTILAALGTGAYFMRETKIAVDEAFVIYNDGRLIAHSTRRLKPGMDDQVLSGMFVAIQDFVKDSFKDVTSFTLRKIEFGEKSVLIEKGDHLFLAVILHGKASKKVAQRMEEVVDEIEEVFGAHLKEWDGDLDKVRGVSDMVKRLYSRAPMLPGPFRRSGE